MQILVAAGVLATFLMLVASVMLHVFVGYPLLAGLILFSLIARKQGHDGGTIAKMVYTGGRKAFVVLKIFIIIGAIISMWMASGTVPAIVYYGIKLIHPRVFVLSAFLICSAVSFLIGTSFGTVGTAGIALMVMGRSGGVNASVLGGAIIAGAYFGDRCSPMSSSANLVAGLTGTDLYGNIRRMMKTSYVPFVMSTIAYLVLSIAFPLKTSGTRMDLEIARAFSINWFVLLPAVLVLVLAALKIDVKLSMFASIVLALGISIMCQHMHLSNTLEYLIFGFHMDNHSKLSTIMQGGGVLPMLKVALVVFLSSAYAGIFEGTGMLDSVKSYVGNARTREGIFGMTAITSLATAAFGCTQALSVILTCQLTGELYEQNSGGKENQAIDLENTAILLSPLVPWNIAGLVPAESLMIGASYIPFAFFLYLIPIYNYMSCRRNSKQT